MAGAGIGTDPHICIESSESEIEDDRMQSITRVYTLSNFSSRLNAESSLLLSPLCPGVDGSYPQCLRRSVSVKELAYDASRDEVDFTATVQWVRWRPPVVDRETISSAINSQTQRVKRTYEHIGSYAPAGQTAIDAHGMINLTEGGAEGVDIPIPILSFEISRLYNKGTATLATAANVFEYVEKPNSVTWRGFAPGTIKIIGINMDDSDPEFDRIGWAFAASQNYTDIVIPTPNGNITVPEKKGWDYLHITEIPDPTQTDSEGFVKWIPHTAHVEQMTETKNLNDVI